MKNYNELITKLRIFRQERNWEKFHKPKDLAMAAAIEAAELMEEFLWKSDDEIMEKVKNEKERIADELADTFVYLMLLADDLKIDMYDAIEKKMAKNAKKYPVEKCKGRSDKYNEIK